MNEEDKHSRSEWYRTGDNAPPEGSIPFPPADAGTDSNIDPPPRTAGASPSYADPYWSSREPAKPPRNRKTGVRVVAICVLVLVLIVATALIFSDGRGVSGGSLSNGGSGNAAEPTATPGYDEDFRDFFNSYYTQDDNEITGENTIAKAPTGADVTLDFTAAPESGELTLQQVYAKCSASVVAITATVDESGYNWGSGIVLTADGYIITNYHVLDGTSAVTVTLQDDTECDAKLVGFDAISDIAVLKIEADGLTPAEFGDSGNLQVGDRVVAIGNPLGEELRGTMTDGIISAISRDISYNNHTMTLLQTNAAINEGNSGGPLINMYGQVVGITNMKMMTSSSYSSVEGIGFAIPSATMQNVVDQLISTGKVTGRPTIGITVGAIPESAADYYELPKGLYISAVSKGSDAEAQGVQAGDILTAVNGTPVTTTYEVSAIKDGLSVGDTLTLTLYRSGKTFDVTVKLVEASDIS